VLPTPDDDAKRIRGGLSWFGQKKAHGDGVDLISPHGLPSCMHAAGRSNRHLMASNPIQKEEKGRVALNFYSAAPIFACMGLGRVHNRVALMVLRMCLLTNTEHYNKKTKIKERVIKSPFVFAKKS
jgi:hypothetical protein